MTGPKPEEATHPAPVLRVSFETAPGQRTELEFRHAFRIGRTDDCDVCIVNEYVSRQHVEVAPAPGGWRVRDLGSRNGIFVNGQRTPEIDVGAGATIRLGIEGPFVAFSTGAPPRPAPATPAAALGSETVVARYIDRYFAKPAGSETVGEHTMLVRQAFSRVQKKQKRKYAWIVGALAVMVAVTGAYSIYQHREAVKQKAAAQEIFYAMKSLDVDIAGFEKLVMESNSRQGMEQIQKYRGRRQDMERSYDRFITALHVYDPKMTPQDRLILRVARIFGECELATPPDFMSEVKNYIKKWQGSNRLAKAVRRARENDYASFISKELLAQGLPPQFFYLALQESDFDPFISGPHTYKGFAKGMWQFIPETGAKYGLKIGPLVDLPRADPADDRHHYDRATKAAARYLKDLYASDAQASGLLVMACYNWGEHNVLPLVRGMPANPRERNFWRLLAAYKDKMPPETYGYVFHIVSAAVIGENPRLFGFDFDNPLEHLETKQ